MTDRLSVVLGPHGKEFKKVFREAQTRLRTVFGMEMVELPAKDRNLMTTDQKRKGVSLLFGHLSLPSY